MRGAPLETLRGEVASVRLLKGDWGKIELRAGSTDAKTATVTGQVIGVDVGSTIECKGRWDSHPSYGKQFKAVTIQTVVPNDSSGAIAFISSKLPGIGRKRATELVERYGIPELWNVLEREPERIAEDVKGVTPDMARAIAVAYAAVRGEREELVTLRGWGLTESQIKRCREVWKGDVVAELRRDPFQLCELVWGFGFTRADQVGQRMGISREHPGRIQAAVLHVLGEAEGQGHCYVPTGKLVALAADLLGIEPRQVWPQLEELCDGERAERTDEGARVYRASTYSAELEIVAGVAALATGLPFAANHVEVAPVEFDPAEAEARAAVVHEQRAAEDEARDRAGYAFAEIDGRGPVPPELDGVEHDPAFAGGPPIDDAPMPEDDDAPPARPAKRGANHAA